MLQQRCLTISDTVASIADPGSAMLSSTSLSNPAILPTADPLLSGVAGLAVSKGERAIRLGTVNTPLSELIGKLRRQLHRNRGNKCQPCSPNSSRTHTQTRRVCRSRSHLCYGQPEPRGWPPRPALEQAPAQVDYRPARVDARHDTEHWGPPLHFLAIPDAPFPCEQAPSPYLPWEPLRKNRHPCDRPGVQPLSIPNSAPWTADQCTLVPALGQLSGPKSTLQTPRTLQTPIAKRNR